MTCRLVLLRCVSIITFHPHKIHLGLAAPTRLVCGGNKIEGGRIVLTTIYHLEVMAC